MQFVISINAQSSIPVYKQISNALRQAILNGTLEHGTRLPSSRDLAQSLNISRLTARRGMEDLASQGLIDSIRGDGVYVNSTMIQNFDPSDDDKEIQNVPIAAPKLSALGERLLAMPAVSAPFSTPHERHSERKIYSPMELLPVRFWREMLHRSCRLDNTDAFSPQEDAFGSQPLRRSISRFLARFRSINCDPSQIVIFSSIAESSDFILRLLSDAKDCIVFETPGVIRPRMQAEAAGLTIIPASVDSEGLIIESLPKNGAARLLYTTPSRNPVSGATMSVARRKALLDWSASSHCLIVEDDLDCEYRYGERLLPSIASLDQNQSVIYRSDFFKVLYPLSQLSFIVLPPRLVRVARAAKEVLDFENTSLEQSALAELIDAGFFERHIRRNQQILARRRAATTLALTRQMKDVAKSAYSAGLHMTLAFPLELPPSLIEASAAAVGLTLMRSSRYYISGAPSNEYLLPFVQKDENEIAAIIENFFGVLSGTSSLGVSHQTDDCVVPPPTNVPLNC